MIGDSPSRTIAEAGWGSKFRLIEKAAIQIESALSSCFVNKGEASAILKTELKLQLELSIVDASQRWRSLERIIQPLIQIPIDNQLLTQQGHQVRQRPVASRLELHILQDQHSDQRSPDLGLRRICAGSVERLDASQLLQAFLA
jgi:hypothetical protein